jgi:hypothetical protein
MAVSSFRRLLKKEAMESFVRLWILISHMDARNPVRKKRIAGAYRDRVKKMPAPVKVNPIMISNPCRKYPGE